MFPTWCARLAGSGTGVRSEGVQGFCCPEPAWRPGNPHAALAWVRQALTGSFSCPAEASAVCWQSQGRGAVGCIARGTLESPGALYYQNASGGEAYILFF